MRSEQVQRFAVAAHSHQLQINMNPFRLLAREGTCANSRYRKVRVSIGRPIFRFWPCITFSLQGQTKFVISNMSSLKNVAIESCLNKISAPTCSPVSLLSG